MDNDRRRKTNVKQRTEEVGKIDFSLIFNEGISFIQHMTSDRKEAPQEVHMVVKRI